MVAKAQPASSAANGGSFESGFVSGALSSAISSAAGAALSPLSKPLRDVGMVAVGGLTGGLGSVIGGGSFWSGVRQGIITSGLNHVMHQGVAGIMSGASKPPRFILNESGYPVAIEKDGIRYDITESLIEDYLIEVQKLNDAHNGALASQGAEHGVTVLGGCTFPVTIPVAFLALIGSYLKAKVTIYNEENKFNTSVRTLANKINVSTLQRQELPLILKLPGMNGFKGYNFKN